MTENEEIVGLEESFAEEFENAAPILKLGLMLRNILAAAASLMFFASVFMHHVEELKIVAYLIGAGAYFCEYLHLTDFFKRRVSHDEAFMIYCFAPIYILMGISYIFN